MDDRPAEREQRVTPLELFFDLVFVFAITQVTTFLSRNPTWGGLIRALLLLGMLWWLWSPASSTVRRSWRCGAPRLRSRISARSWATCADGTSRPSTSSRDSV